MYNRLQYADRSGTREMSSRSEGGKVPFGCGVAAANRWRKAKAPGWTDLEDRWREGQDAGALTTTADRAAPSLTSHPRTS
jgi:hypothetical protein